MPTPPFKTQDSRRSHAPSANYATASRRALAARVPKDRQGELAYWIDRALAFRFDPSETLLLSGFWRSGTTWLQEALREVLYAKTLFEPLCPLTREAQAIHAYHGVGGRSFEFLRMYMPYCSAEKVEGPLYEAFLRLLRSTSWGSWVRRFRKGLSESFRPRLVVKVVTAQLCLRSAQDTFGMPVLHVYRDPRAVIASVKKTRWSWLFNHLSLREQLLDLPDGRGEYFGRWRDEILAYDRADPVTRIAAYWALTEKYLQESYAGYRGRLVCASYEQLVQGRERIFREVLGKLELRPWQEDFVVPREDSTTTSRAQRGASVNERVEGWKDYLSTSDIAAIDSIVTRFGLADRLAACRSALREDVVHGVARG
jgi:hypothetical protein